MERHHRFASPLLVLKERDEENHGCDERCDDRRRRPAVLVGFDERVGEAEERAGSQGQSGDVEVSRLLRPRLSDRSQADDETEDPDRDVDEEHRRPADVLDQIAAERWTERERKAGNAGPDPDRLRALVRGEGDREDGERPGHEERSADALEAAERDEVARRTRQAAHQREEGEHSEAGQEGAFATVAVSEDPARQHQSHGGAADPVDDPGVEVMREPGERDVHDRVVEHGHEQREAARQENQDLLSLVVALEHAYLVSRMRRAASTTCVLLCFNASFE